MPDTVRICRQPECGARYTAGPHHPGCILDCPACAKEHMPPPMGMMISGKNKHASEMELTITHDHDMARRWSKAQRRSGGQGVLKGIVERKS